LLDIRLPGSDGAAAADPLERGRRDVEHLCAARYRPARLRAELARLRLRLYAAAGFGLVHRYPDGRVALDVAGRAAGLCGLALDRRQLLPRGADRRRLALGGVSPHPATQ